jgi:steroid 5-alpha reductase family enzyme
MIPWNLIIIASGAVAAVFTVTWLRQRATGNAGVVDVIWTAVLGGLAGTAAAFCEGDPVRRMVLAILAGSWCIRLTVYLWQRYDVSDEDPRYTAFAAKWGRGAGMLGLFLLQGAITLLLAVAYLAVALSTEPFGTVLDWIAVTVGAGSILGEAVADHQLARFKADSANRGLVCDQGLWRYSRHPNYFFEWLHWWAYPLLACCSPIGPVAFFAPVLMLFLVLFVSGIPLAEEQSIRRRGEAYRAYQARTSAFIPWFPGKETS